MGVLQSFYSNFISFFGTNLLTQCPVLVAVFCLFFRSQEINIKQSPNTVKLYRDFFWTRRNPMGQSCTWGGAPRGTQPTSVRHPPWRAQVGCAHLGYLFGPLDVFWSKKISKKIRCIWTQFGIDFLRSKNMQNNNWHWALCQ